MPNEVKLLPCPFCGTEPKPINFDEIETLCPPDCPCADLQCKVEAWNTRPTTVVTDEVVERDIAEIIHDAMFWAARQGGQPQRWQNGNSFAEARAREAARRALASMPIVVTGE